MVEALELFFYFLNRGIFVLFKDVEIVEGVSLGWFFVSIFVFTVMIQFLLAIPRIRVASGRGKRKASDDE